jgi:hypothetical protein
MFLADSITPSVRLADRRLDRAAGGRDVLAVASTSTTVHRSDCALLEGRDDLTPAGPGGPASPPAVSATPPAERGQIWS